MTKKEIKDLNNIKTMTIKEAKMFRPKSVGEAQAFKHGFNLARRKIRFAILKEVRIFYTCSSEDFCPFCKEYAGNCAFVESNNCGGYRAHEECFDKLKKWQKKTKRLIAVLPYEGKK